MERIILLASGVALCVVMFLLSGCAAITPTDASRFYVLSPMAESDLEKIVLPGKTGKISIGIAPITLPKYLKKSQIVTRTGNNELQLAEFDRWAGKIEEDIGRVVAENLSYLLATDKIVSHPAISSVETDYKIELDLSRFDGRLGESVELVARWVILDKQGNTVKNITSTRIKKPVQGFGYADMVEAQSRALAALSRDLAEAITELTEK
ncbi:MAG: membrane integrity-associated transporter subunit PqiC [Deltaproteobacteria bacterium]|jgi:uncharacterized lipoprotein YmbA|nr:membrane integrity-associated transporter subunit PqiC [Deltaproteobacteria bacterium]